MAEAIRPVIVRVLRGRGEQVDLIVRSLKSSSEIIPWIKSNAQKNICIISDRSNFKQTQIMLASTHLVPSSCTRIFPAMPV